MLTGMTGFVHLHLNFKGIQVNIEIRSLNHRYLDCQLHLPDGFGAAEDILKARIKETINRGRISVSLSAVRNHPRVLVDYELADNYVRNLKALNQRLKLHDNLSISQIVSLEGVLKVEKIHLSLEFILALKTLINKAIIKLAAFRKKEGRILTGDVLKRLGVIRSESLKITRAVKFFSARKKGLLSADEYSAFLKNTDVAEELTRINYHLNNFLDTIKKKSAVGKELDFISQEIQREANTISSKAQSAQISASVVKIKSAIEQIREQLQNVE